jgi:hypothetical protein
MTLQGRLNSVAKRGALSTADLAVWFTMPYQTVRSYREGRRCPTLARRLAIEQRLRLLERALKTDCQLPIPLSVRNHQRQRYIKGILTRANRRR